MKIPPLTLPCALALAATAHGQIVVERVFPTNQSIPDNAQYVDTRTISNSGFTSITDVGVSLALSGATGSTMRLGDYFVSLTHGTASEDERVAVLLNRPRMTNVSPFGSSLSWANLTLDDTVGAPNVFFINSNTGVYQADGRLSVDPYSSPVAYDGNAVTHGLSALRGDFLASDKWSLLVADTRQGALGRLDGWTLRITGLPAANGSVDPGAGGSISDAPGPPTNDCELKADLTVTGSGAARVTANVRENLVLSGGLTGSGELFKTGAGKLTIGGVSGNFGGTLQVDAGSLEIASGASLGGVGSSVIVGTAGTLTGSGSINGAVIVDGVLSPGAAIGKLESGALTFDNLSTFAYEMDSGLNPSVAADLQIVKGDLTLIGHIDLTLSASAFAPNTTLSLIQYTGSLLGEGGFFFGGTPLTDGTVFNDGLNTWKISYAASSDEAGLNFANQLGGNFITLSNLTAIPESGSLLALGCLIGSSALLRRRQTPGSCQR